MLSIASRDCVVSIPLPNTATQENINIDLTSRMTGGSRHHLAVKSFVCLTKPRVRLHERSSSSSSLYKDIIFECGFIDLFDDKTDMSCLREKTIIFLNI